MWLKMCPKCGGDLYLRQEIDGKDIICAQCGFMRFAPPGKPSITIVKELAREKEPARERVAA